MPFFFLSSSAFKKTKVEHAVFGLSIQLLVDSLHATNYFGTGTLNFETVTH